MYRFFNACRVARRNTSPSAANPAGRAAARTFGVLSIVLAVAGCATTTDRPYEAIARAEASITQAEQSGARQYGATELAAARDKLTRARTAVERDDMDEAKRYAEQAALDAELAAAIGRNREAEKTVQELNDSIEALQDEIARNQNSRGERR